MENNVTEVLRKHNLKVTATRTKVLEQFYLNDHALTHHDLETTIPELDRVTIYRTLNAFEENGITHKVMNPNGVATFALCRSQCTEHVHHDNHFHFQCYECEKTFCLDEILHQTIHIPKGFIMKDVKLFIGGVCNNCTAK